MVYFVSIGYIGIELRQPNSYRLLLRASMLHGILKDGGLKMREKSPRTSISRSIKYVWYAEKPDPKYKKLWIFILSTHLGIIKDFILGK